MAFMETPCATVRVYTDNGVLTLKAMDFEVNRPITDEVFNSDFGLDHKWVLEQEDAGKTIEIGNSLDVYFTRDTVTSYLYSGKVWNFDLPILGHAPRGMRVFSRGWGDELIGKYFGFAGTRDTTIDNVIKWIVAPLVSDGKITTNNVASSSQTINFEGHWADQITCWDAIREICTNYHWDFYVDKDRDLHAFPMGSLETPEVFTNLMSEVSYSRSGDRIINSQRVIGASGKTIGSDADYTDGTVGWSTSADTIAVSSWTRGVLIGGGTIDPDPDYGAGSWVIRAVDDDASGGLWVEKNFQSSIDLSMFGNLHFACKYVFDSLAGRHNVETSCIMEIQFKTDDSNYFSTQIQFPGKTREEWAVKPDAGLGPQFPSYRWVYGWMPLDITFNMLASHADMIATGSPRWDEISRVRISIVKPLPLAGIRSGAVLKVDNMYFDSGFYYSFRQDSTSITQYGERRGKLLFDESLQSDLACEEIADDIILNYKDPLPVFNNITLRDFVDVSPGYRATITVKEITDESVIRNVIDRFDGLNYHRHLELSPVPYRDWEDILSDLQKFRDEQLQDNLPENINPTALFHFLTSPLGDEDIDLAHSGMNLVRNPHFEIDTDLDSIPDAWFPSDDSLAYRSQDETYHGQWSGWIQAGKTLSSTYFPIDPNGGYTSQLYGRAEHDGSYATISAKLVYYEATPNLTPISTHSIIASQSPTSWTRYQLVHDYVSVPTNARWGRIQLVGESGTVGFFDDVSVERLWAVDGGRINYVRPEEFSTSETTYQLIWSDTWDPTQMNSKYVAIRLGADLRSAGGNGTSDLKVVLSANGVPKDTFYWSELGTSYGRYQSDGTLDVCDWGETLTVEYNLKTETGESDVAYMKNPTAWINAVSLRQLALSPFDGARR